MVSSNEWHPNGKMHKHENLCIFLMLSNDNVSEKVFTMKIAFTNTDLHNVTHIPRIVEFFRRIS